MKVVAVVPMKLNNQRLPGKNTRCFSDGTPLCNSIFSTLLNVKLIDEIYVFCSDPQIVQYIPDGIKYIERSKSLDQNCTTMNEVLKSFTSIISSDIYILTHATAPFVSKESIEKGLRAVLNNGFDSAFSVKKVQDFLWKDGKPINYKLNDIPRTQDLPIIYEETCGFYIFQEHLIKNMNRRIGDNPFMVEVSEIEAIDVDTHIDFEIADAIYTKIINKEE